MKLLFRKNIHMDTPYLVLVKYFSYSLCLLNNGRFFVIKVLQRVFRRIKHSANIYT